MTRRFLTFVLAALTLAAPAFAMNQKSGEGRMTAEQRKAIAALKDVDLEVDADGVPSHLMGRLSDRGFADPIGSAEEALQRHGAAFRRGTDDGFAYRLHEDDELGQTHVRMTQTFRGFEVVGGELIVHMDGGSIRGINGRFVADLDVDTRPVLSAAQAADKALLDVDKTGGQYGLVVDTEQPVVFVAEGGAARLAIPVTVFYHWEDGPALDRMFVDAQTGATLGRHPKMYTAKFRKIYNLNQGCVTTGSNLPGTLMFQEGGSSADTAATGAYNGTGKTYDYYFSVHNRDSYDNLGAQLVSTVHAQFSNGVSCTKNNAAWFGSPFNQMGYGDGTLPTFSNLANGLDVTSHELTHAVTDKTAGLVYSKESGALNEGTSDILGRTAAFWNGDGNPATTTNWTIGADVYTPSTAGDALRYMYDPKKDGQSADYYPTRNYSGACSPSSSNDQCGVHTNSGIANLFYFLVSQGGTHPRGTTSVVVPAIGITKARAIWYRALVSYMTSGETFANARTHTAQAAADLYGGTCTPEWQAVHKGWDAVGVGGSWNCGAVTYSISGSAGTSGATVSAGAAGSATSDASGNYTISNLAAGTYTITPSKAGCTFSPASQSVTVGPNATGKNFTATCGGGSQLLGNAGFESGNVTWTATAGVITSSASKPARTGSWKAWFGGNGTTATETCYQQVTIPAGAASATLSFWMRIDTAETTTTTAYDTLKVQIRNSANTVLATLATYSNLNANATYTQKSFDVTSYKGQTIRVYFLLSEDSSLQTSFVVDDTALNTN